MKNAVTALLFCALGATSALAVFDSTPDLFGLYFDEAADVPCLFEAPLPYVPLAMYLTYTNPSVDEIAGFEVGITGDGYYLILEVMLPCLVIDPVDLDNIMIGCPIPCTETTVLATFTLLNSAPTEPVATFTVRNAADSSHEGDLPVVYLVDGSVLRPSVLFYPDATSGWGLECYPVPAVQSSWGTVKSLYR